LLAEISAADCGSLGAGVYMSAPAVPAARVLRFDIFELDLYAGELRKGGIKLRLQGQPVQVLAILLQSAGSLVTREELRSQLWHGDTFVDFDHSLHNAIARIREALGDSPQTPRYIETLPRRGYRFIAPVEEVQPAGISVESGTGVNGAVVTLVPAAKQPNRRASLILTLCAGCVMGLAAWGAWHHLRVRAEVPPPRSIAVLPFRNLSGDRSQEYFADAMTEELITELSRSRALTVISHTSVIEYKDTKKHLPQISRELKVEDIVEGSVVREGDQVRVTVQLLDAANDRHIWSEDYQRPLRNILNLQREVAQGIAQQIRVKLGPEQQARLSPARAVDPAAYEAYLRGRYYLNTYFTSAQPLNTARQYFEQAVQRDPEFSPAYGGLADTYLNLGRFGSLSPQAAYSSAHDASRKALGLDQSNGEAHVVLALLSWQYERDWVAAEREFSNSIDLAPAYDCARAYHALYLAWKQRPHEALAEITKSRELNPGSSFASTESAVYFQLRDYPGLTEASRKGVDSDPNEWLEHYFLGVGYEGSGRRAEAIPEYQKAIQISDGDPDPTAALAHAYAVIGRTTEAEQMLRALEAKSKDSYISPYLIATIYAGLGQKATAFKFLEEAFRERCLDAVWYLKTDPRIDNLRSDPQFPLLLQRIGFPT
jgi:TolB-like protein/DNA-binding winged helix-turn-helix (wHTH) protein/Flp pilus assembly protein TadD